MSRRRLLIIGLDSADPHLVFEKWLRELPNISALSERGCCGSLVSCIPPITVPAWSCMTTGKDPGTLGCYGYRNRTDYSRRNLSFATSSSIKEYRIWDILGDAGKQSILLGIPQTYPPKPLNGCMVCGFLTPDTSHRYTYPEKLAAEIKELIGDYIIDADNFRTDNKQVLLAQLYEMALRRFALFRHLITSRDWDFAMMVEMGIDRMHHGFWRYMDTSHPNHSPGTPFTHAIRDYYRFIDTQIGKILSCLEDGTAVMIVSDHGAQAMRGGVCINEWLLRHGYLNLKRPASSPTPLEKADVDWDRTTAWAEGGYFARVFLNVAGREPSGTVQPDRYEITRRKLKETIEMSPELISSCPGTRVFLPEEIYAETNGVPPDLLVYFGNLQWRSIGTVGWGSLFTTHNDTGPDDANHAENGIYMLHDPACPGYNTETRNKKRSLLDIAPTALDILNVSIPDDMQGKSLLS